MRPGMRRWHFRFAAVLALALAAGWAQAQTQEPPADQDPVEEEAGLPFDDLLESEDLLRPEGYTYEAGGRRDPFRSLLASRVRVQERGPRPEGIPGLLIDEIDITGIFVLDDGPVAQIRSTDQEQSYLLREGDQLFDGDVVSISTAEVVFKQIVDDPTAIKPFREVVKNLESEGPR